LDAVPHLLIELARMVDHLPFIEAVGEDVLNRAGGEGFTDSVPETLDVQVVCQVLIRILTRGVAAKQFQKGWHGFRVNDLAFSLTIVQLQALVPQRRYTVGDSFLVL
jgi:hypothetical protein